MHQVAVYESTSKVLIPMNDKGTMCYIGTTIREAEAQADNPEERKQIIRTLRRYLYTSADGSMFNTQLLAVYKLYELHPVVAI